MNHLLIAGISFTTAKELKLSGLFTDITELAATAASSRLKRTPDFQPFGKTWGSLVDEFISRKWNCITAIIEYLQMVSTQRTNGCWRIRKRGLTLNLLGRSSGFREFRCTKSLRSCCRRT